MASNFAVGLLKGLGKAAELDYKRKELERKQKWQEGQDEKKIGDALFTYEAQKSIEANLKNKDNLAKFDADTKGYLTNFFSAQAKAQNLTGQAALKFVNKSLSKVTQRDIERMRSGFGQRAVDVTGRKVGDLQAPGGASPTVPEGGFKGTNISFASEGKKFVNIKNMKTGEVSSIREGQAVPPGFALAGTVDATDPKGANAQPVIQLQNEVARLKLEPPSEDRNNRIAQLENIITASGATPGGDPEIIDLQQEIAKLQQGPQTSEVQERIGELKSAIQAKGVQPKAKSVFLQQQDRIGELSKTIKDSTDPLELKVANDQLAHIMGNMSEATDRMRTSTMKALREDRKNIGTLNIAASNVGRLMEMATAEMGGPRAFAVRVADNAKAYFRGIVGSDRSAANIFVDLDNVIAGTSDPKERAKLEARRKEMSNAYKLGTVEFLEGVIRYDIANALRQGQKLTADDLARADRMLSGSMGSEAFASGLKEAMEQVAMRREVAVSVAAESRGLVFEDMRSRIDPDTHLRTWYYRDKETKKLVKFKI